MVRDQERQEQKLQILQQYYAEREPRFAEVAVDPEAHARGLRDGLGMLGGLALAASGMILGFSKERR
ncbi:TPA: hypothetical protein DIV55_02285 [Patescibacteria group bacterium]|uniref:Uncharacterized protein n=1 Tax=Candidatus Gottesmanbacteria bacterium GW2011_GWA1_43_11 TaxID=1618436 RepID=A0A0G1CFU8_9BACT|nr:MAG: hypothetical protein UV59_C0021G0015 [Candidatus Gottesmanbacteria bacterium GW2011_GWA1_43_11]HCS78550.1 hypothetical protein [Patescibacteria group bacterium]